MPRPEVQPLEEISVDSCWNEAMAALVPETAGVDQVSAMRKTFLAGLFTALAFEERLRREPGVRRTRLLDGMRNDAQGQLQRIDLNFPH
jgi:hypothetical protein